MLWVAGKTVWSPCYTRAISKRFGDKQLIIKRYINSPSLLFTFLHYQYYYVVICCRAYGHSPGSEAGVLCDTISTKTLFYLISTLNASFYPDYDFSNAKSSEFSREPSLQVTSLLLVQYCRLCHSITISTPGVIFMLEQQTFVIPKTL